MSEYSVENDREYSIWGRNCMVDLIFDCYKGEEIEKYQEKAIEDFELNLQRYSKNALTEIKNYISKNYKDELGGDNLENIFKYVVPRTVFVKKNSSKKMIVGLICHFKFDDENNLAVKFVDGKISDIGGEQVVL